SLQQQPYTIVVPALAGTTHSGTAYGGWRVGETIRAITHVERRRGTGHDHNGEVGNGLGGARDCRGIPAENPGTVVVMRTQGEVGLLQIAHTGKGPLRVPPAKLAVVERGRECYAFAGMGGDGQAIVHHIGRAWGNSLRVGQGTRRPGIAFVDLVTMLIH